MLARNINFATSGMSFTTYSAIFSMEGGVMGALFSSNYVKRISNKQSAE